MITGTTNKGGGGKIRIGVTFIGGVIIKNLRNKDEP